MEDVGYEPSVKCGMWTGRKEGASSLGERLEPADALCWLWWRWACGLSGNAKAAVGVWFWKVCVLFTVGLQASSLWRFLLLMRVPSGLLRVSWPGPRKEMMQLAPSSSLRLCLNSEHQKRGTSAEAPVGLKNCENRTESQGFCWVDTHVAALVAVSEGSLSSGGSKGSDWCSSSISTPVWPPSPQYFSFVAS